MQRRIALLDAVSPAAVIDGPVGRTKAKVGERTLQLGREGGYLSVPDPVPPFPNEHVDALSGAVERYRRYPQPV